MQIELTEKEFRRLLDMVYIGNWVLNSTRGNDRFSDYDEVESKLFSKCPSVGMPSLCEYRFGTVLPSRAFEEGGIHEAIETYEDVVFFDILAEELARRDMGIEPASPAEIEELKTRMEEYITEFEAHGVENITIDK